MPSPPALASVADVVRGLFSWLADVAIERGVLAIRSATGRIDLAPDRQPPTPGPPAARQADDASGLAFYPGIPGMGTWTDPPSVWRTVSAPGVRPQVWAKLFVCGTTGPLDTDEGTRSIITTGSARVTIG